MGMKLHHAVYLHAFHMIKVYRPFLQCIQPDVLAPCYRTTLYIVCSGPYSPSLAS